MDSNDFRLSTRLQLSPEVTEAVYSGIAEIDAIKHTFRLTDRLLPHTLERLTQTVMTSTGASNRIEGNRLADDELNSVVSILKANRYIAPVLTFEKMVLSKQPAQDPDSHACLIGEFYMDWASGQIKDIPIADLETKIREGGEGAAASNGMAKVPTSNGTLSCWFSGYEPSLKAGATGAIDFVRCLWPLAVVIIADLELRGG